MPKTRSILGRTMFHGVKYNPSDFFEVGFQIGSVEETPFTISGIDQSVKFQKAWEFFLQCKGLCPKTYPQSLASLFQEAKESKDEQTVEVQEQLFRESEIQKSDEYPTDSNRRAKRKAKKKQKKQQRKKESLVSEDRIDGIEMPVESLDDVGRENDDAQEDGDESACSRDHLAKLPGEASMTVASIAAQSAGACAGFGPVVVTNCIRTESAKSRQTCEAVLTGTEENPTTILKGEVIAINKDDAKWEKILDGKTGSEGRGGDEESQQPPQHSQLVNGIDAVMHAAYTSPFNEIAENEDGTDAATGEVSTQDSKWKTVGGTKGAAKSFRASKIATSTEQVPTTLLSPTASKLIAKIKSDAIIIEFGQCSYSDKGYIIGHGGSVIKELTARSCCSVQLDKESLRGGQLYQITYTGTRQQIDLAKRMVEAVIETRDGVATLEPFPDLRIHTSDGPSDGPTGEDRLAHPASKDAYDESHSDCDNDNAPFGIVFNSEEFPPLSGKREGATPAAPVSPAIAAVVAPMQSAAQSRSVRIHSARQNPWGHATAANSAVMASQESPAHLPTLLERRHNYKTESQTAANGISSYASIITEFGHCSHSDRGYIIGKEGCVINELQARSCCSVSVNKDPLPGGQSHKITYTGTRQQIDLAKRMVEALVAETGKGVATLEHFPDLRVSVSNAPSFDNRSASNVSSDGSCDVPETIFAPFELSSQFSEFPPLSGYGEGAAVPMLPTAQSPSLQIQPVRAGTAVTLTPWKGVRAIKEAAAVDVQQGSPGSFSTLLGGRRNAEEETLGAPTGISLPPPATPVAHSANSTISLNSTTSSREPTSALAVSPVVTSLAWAPLLLAESSPSSSEEFQASFKVPPSVKAALSGRTILFCKKMEAIFSVRIVFDADGCRLLAACDNSEQLNSFAAYMAALTVQTTPAKMLDAMIGFPAVPAAPEPAKVAAADPLIDITEVFDEIIGADRHVANYLEREYGVSLSVEDQHSKWMLSVNGDPEAVDSVRVAIMHILEDAGMRKWQQFLAEQRQKMVYVFVDLDAWLLPKLMSLGVDDSFSLKAANRSLNAADMLVDVVSNLRTVVRRAVVGSLPSEHHPLWAEFQEADFSSTYVPSLKHDNGREFRESSELVLLQQILPDFFMHAGESRTIILVASSDCTAYSYLIEAALQRFWQVELWSWRGEGVALYNGFSQRFPDHFSMRYLDEHFEFITSSFQHDQHFFSYKSAAGVSELLPQPGDECKSGERPITHCDIWAATKNAAIALLEHECIADGSIQLNQSEIAQCMHEHQHQHQQLYAPHTNDFECPILRSEMQDPVVAEDGFTYERRAIEEWLADHDISPITGSPMGKDLIPNLVLRCLVIQSRKKAAPF